MLLCLALLALGQAAQPFLSNVFGDHMVLQRDRPSRLFGFAPSGTSVTTQMKSSTFSQSLVTTAGSDGIWRQELPMQPASSNPFAFTITATGLSASLVDVLFGDVHICSGQSNMQFTTINVPNASTEIADADNYGLIRVFTVGQATSSPTPLLFLQTVEQPWAAASHTSIGGQAWAYFSAVCWFTYRDVFNGLGKNVPQGLISDNWGGTPIEHWSSPEALKVCNAAADSVLWNAMVVPYTVGPMAVRTAIWYQGESNVGRAAAYDCQMRSMIHDWRQKLPGLGTFGFVQIASCDCYSGTTTAADLRQAQLSPLRALPNIAVATAIDLVDVPGGSTPQDIHPPAKQPVGARLAQQILAREYGIGQVENPMFLESVSSGSATQVTVQVALTGCLDTCELRPVICPPKVPAAHCAGFAIQTSDGVWRPATASMVDANNLLLSAPVPKALDVNATSYGRADWPIVTLYSKTNSLPVLPWCNSIGRAGASMPCYGRVPEQEPRFDMADYKLGMEQFSKF
jgi:sialate O-acetylesterase